MSSKNSRKPSSRSLLVISTNTGKRTSSVRWITSSCWAILPALRPISASLSLTRLSHGMTSSSPLMGQFGRLRRSNLRNSGHSCVSPGATSSNISRPAVSSSTARLVNHQFMLMVPPTPCISSCKPGGKPDVAMPDGLRLARAGLADDDVPRQRVHVLAGRGELLHADLERALHRVEFGAGVGVADGVGGRCAVLGDGTRRAPWICAPATTSGRRW